MIEDTDVTDESNCCFIIIRLKIIPHKPIKNLKKVPKDVTVMFLEFR